MKAIIKSVKFQKEYETKFGLMYGFKVTYDDKSAYYSSKKKEQTTFIEGQEAEFTEEKKQGQNGDYLTIKPIKQAYNAGSNYGRAIKKEQSKYSGFSDSYVKDMLNSGILKPEVDEEAETYNDIVMLTWKKRAFEIFNHMVELDKTIES
jgi:hypothetical protein